MSRPPMKFCITLLTALVTIALSVKARRETNDQPVTTRPKRLLIIPRLKPENDLYHETEHRL